MKTKLNITLFLFFLSQSIFAQVPNYAVALEDPDFSTYYLESNIIPAIKGKVSHLPNGPVSVKYVMVTPFGESQEEKITETDAEGNFELSLGKALPYQQIWLSVDTFFYTGIYIRSKLFIALNAAKLIEQGSVNFAGDGISYQGKDGVLNQIFNDHILFKRQEQLDIGREIRQLHRNRKLPFSAFKIKYDELYKKLHAIDDEFIQANPSEYGWLIQNERMSAYYGLISVKHWGKDMDDALFQEMKKHKTYLVSNDASQYYGHLYTYLKYKLQKTKQTNWETFKNYTKIDQEGLIMLDSMIYLNGLKESGIYDKKAYRRFLRKTKTYFADTLAEIQTRNMIAYLDEIFPSGKADLLKLKISNKDLKTQEVIQNIVLKNLKTPWCKSILQIKLMENNSKVKKVDAILAAAKELDSHLDLGEPIAELSFGAKLYKVNGIKGEELLTNLIRTFKGKAMIIDFWATWCAPCIGEMPSSKKLHEQTQDLPLEYVYLCTSNGSDINKWKNKIVELEQPGIHIFVEETIESELMSLFSFSGFPSYLYIDQKGDAKPDAIQRISHMTKNSLEDLLSLDKK